MKRFYLFSVIATLATLSFDSSALAGKEGKGKNQDPEKFVERQLKKQDTNSDGAIDKTEFKGKEKAFGKLDTNSDGKLDKAELLAAAQERASKQGGKKKGE